jgi:hypothetical protein
MYRYAQPSTLPLQSERPTAQDEHKQEEVVLMRHPMSHQTGTPATHRRLAGPAGSALNTISIRVERRYGTAIIRSSVTAPSIEQALKLAGEGARVVFPIDGEAFFASAKEDS